MAITSCGLQLVVGYTLGISTWAVIWAFKKLRLRQFVKTGVKEIQEEQKKVDTAIKKVKKAKNIVAEQVEEDFIKVPKEKQKDKEEQNIILE